MELDNWLKWERGEENEIFIRKDDKKHGKRPETGLFPC
jgi:hypothetical protein